MKSPMHICEECYDKFLCHVCDGVSSRKAKCFEMTPPGMIPIVSSHVLCFDFVLRGGHLAPLGMRSPTHVCEECYHFLGRFVRRSPVAKQILLQ